MTFHDVRILSLGKIAPTQFANKSTLDEQTAQDHKRNHGLTLRPKENRI